MSKRLSGRVAVITGSASGIGRKVALRLAAEGAAVAIADLDEGKCRAVVAEVETEGGRALGRRTDVTDIDQVRALYRETEQTFGRLDTLVNNAGIVLPSSIADTTPADWDAVFSVDLKAPFFCIQQAMPAMQRAGGGRVVNIASMAGLRGLACRPAYSAAKGGLIAMTQQAAAELAGINVQVNAIAPGVIETPLGATYNQDTMKAMLANVPAARRAAPEEIAAVVAFLVSDDASYITGTVIPVDGGLVNTVSIDAPGFHPTYASTDDHWDGAAVPLPG